MTKYGRNLMLQLNHSMLLLFISVLVSTAHIPTQLKFSNDDTSANSTSTSSSRIQTSHRESSYQAAIHARELIQYRSEGISTLISNYPEDHPDPTLRGQPIGLQEYFSPYPNGDLVLLVLPISATFRNVLSRGKGEKMTLTVSIRDELGERQRKGPIWAANRRRISIIGELEVIKDEESKQEAKILYETFHPDSPFWSGNNGPHTSFWGRLVVRQVYYFGGFGDRSAIGWLDIPTYQSEFKDTPIACDQSTCFHPHGINLYCEQPIDDHSFPDQITLDSEPGQQELSA